MAVPNMRRFLISIPLWLFLVSFMPSTRGQECLPENPEQCELDYYCDEDYLCRQCAKCEHFEALSSCARSLEDCGVCLDGYEFNSPGKCVARYTMFYFWVAAACSTGILIIVAIIVALYCVRKNKNTYWTSRGSEDCHIISATEVTSPLPPLRHPSAPPPPPPYSPQPAFNSYYTGSSEPLLKQVACAQQIEMDAQQMANPYSNCVRLPPDIHRYNFEETQLDIEDNLSGHAEGHEIQVVADEINNNNMVLPQSASGRVGQAAANVEPPEATLSDTSRVQECNTTVESIDCGQDSGSSRSTSSDTGSQHLIVQFINNISPVLNLQGNNIRR